MSCYLLKDVKLLRMFHNDNKCILIMLTILYLLLNVYILFINDAILKLIVFNASAWENET